VKKIEEQDEKNFKWNRLKRYWWKDLKSKVSEASSDIKTSEASGETDWGVRREKHQASEVAKVKATWVKMQWTFKCNRLKYKNQLEDLIEKDWRSSEWICRHRSCNVRQLEDAMIKINLEIKVISSCERQSNWTWIKAMGEMQTSLLWTWFNWFGLWSEDLRGFDYRDWWS
jgi:hypothetical protein